MTHPDTKIILATGTDQGFVYEPYLRTVNEHSQAENYLICVDFWPHPNTRAAFPNINFRLIRRDQIDTNVPVNCVQNGDFLKVLDLKPNDVIVFTDGDVRMQRPFSDKELEWLKGFRYGDVSAQYNAGVHDTLWWDTQLIGMTNRDHVWHDLLEDGKYAEKTLFNVGVVVCTARTYKIWHDIYVKRWPQVEGAFTHQAKQQWLMSLILFADMDANIKPMPYEFHTHGCFALPPGSRMEGGKLYYNNELVLFRHNVRGDGW